MASDYYVEIADLSLEPEIAEQYIVEQSASKSLLVQSGISQSTPAIVKAANAPGRTIDMPLWDDLTGDSSVVTDSETEITSGQITADISYAQKDYRAKSFKSSALIKVVAGSDPVRVFLDRFIDYWVREEQTIMLAKLTGMFEAASMAVLLNDISIENGDDAQDANLIDSDAILDTFHLNGDRWSMFQALCMHSVPFRRLQGLDLIDNVKESAQSPEIPYYKGRRVLVDDDMTATAGTTSGYRYSTFVFGTGAFARAPVPIDEPLIETVREPLQGLGGVQYETVSRLALLLHPQGLSSTTSVTTGNFSPTNAQLIVGTNWERVWLQKNIRVAQLITNG